MQKIVVRKGHDPYLYFKNAQVQVKPALTAGITRAMYVTETVATSIAPKYNSAKWVAYAKFTHHIRSGKGGRLKRSIKFSKVRNIGRKWISSLYSKVKYSSYQEKGFLHKGAGRYIRGKLFMYNALQQLDKKFMGWQIQVELAKMFKRLG